MSEPDQMSKRKMLRKLRLAIPEAIDLYIEREADSNSAIGCRLHCGASTCKRCSDFSMKQFLALIFMVAFVAIQFVDMALLDSAPNPPAGDISVVSDQQEADQWNMACNVNCPCQSLHSMWLTTSAANCASEQPSSQTIQRSVAVLKPRSFGPAVPPPNA